MGAIRKILAKVQLPSPNLGWNVDEESFCLPFSVELKEDFHIHWQDIRIEMKASDFDEFARAINNAHKAWVEDGKPESLESIKWYGTWPGEEGLDNGQDRHIRKDRYGRLRHHYRLFPRTQTGKLYYDSIMQIEIQQYNWFHIHYKNFRWEVGPKSFLEVSDAFSTAARRYRRSAPAWFVRDTFARAIRKCRTLLAGSIIGRIKRWLLPPK